jgi:hypothetical protein
MLRYQKGLFLPASAAGPRRSQVGANAEAEELFLQSLDELAKQGCYVGIRPGTNFAPAIMAKTALCKTVGKDALLAAMHRLLFDKKTLKLGPTPNVRKSKQTQVILRMRFPMWSETNVSHSRAVAAPKAPNTQSRAALAVQSWSRDASRKFAVQSVRPPSDQGVRPPSDRRPTRGLTDPLIPPDRSVGRTVVRPDRYSKDDHPESRPTPPHSKSNANITSAQSDGKGAGGLPLPREARGISCHNSGNCFYN